MPSRPFLVLAACIFILPACAAMQDQRSAVRQVDDANASIAIKSAMLRAEGFALSGVDVEVTEGVALLGGSVPREEDRVYAECLAWSAPAVRSVANHLKVGEGRGMRRAAGDVWITQRVRARLAGDGSVRSVNYNIETHRGVVYLLGFARDATERDRAAQLASLVGGVERVVVLVRTGGEAPDLPPRGEMRAELCDAVARGEPLTPAEESGAPDTDAGTP
ncbi:BON domain-containing protein [Alkalicaulis satelles]|uniref:BON domain-containing protein n=1 Tax=Alkalicaulis satelles TaxID=2609175 RepID=A0A5M6ZIC5_9PROT|nr:BON domain-containing protein [Alkalicaulis satelles]KAA5803785.1 BON domain-containing protein [Alkalicaulis satelles]